MSDIRRKVQRATHAFITVSGGIVTAIYVDTDDPALAELLMPALRAGATVERIPLEDTRRGLLFEPWPARGTSAGREGE